jgi:hypothetical protein
LTKSPLPAGLGIHFGAFARGLGGIGWICGLLVCSAVITALAQQTLP